MPARFQILGSSSSGNCALLETGQTKILIDAGFSGRRTEQMLKDRGIHPEEIDAVFLTHEHHDHACGLRGLSRHGHLQFFANMDTAQGMQAKLPRPISWKIFETNRPFVFRDLTIHPMTVPHDAYDPVCFFFEWGEVDLFCPRRPSIGWINDLGHVPSALLRRMADADTLVIEANHDERMLEEDSKRPWSLKQRIRSRHGHLSNKDTLEALQKVENPQWRNLYFTHLSRDCNDVSLVEDTFAPLVTDPRLSCQISVVSPFSEQIAPLDFAHFSLS